MKNNLKLMDEIKIKIYFLKLYIYIYIYKKVSWPPGPVLTS